MAMVQPKSQKARLFFTLLLLLLFIAAIMFPLLMVVAISLRQGNFATGSLIPEQISWDHWKLALGFSVEQADGRICLLLTCYCYFLSLQLCSRC